LRQYFPQGTALSGYTQVELDAVVERMNDRPGKALSFATPKEAFSKLLAELNKNFEIKPGVASQLECALSNKTSFSRGARREHNKR